MGCGLYSFCVVAGVSLFYDTPMCGALVLWRRLSQRLSLSAPRRARTAGRPWGRPPGFLSVEGTTLTLIHQKIPFLQSQLAAERDVQAG